MLCMLSSVFVQGVRAAYESEIDLLKTSLRDEKALNTETARKHKIELEELKKDIAEKVFYLNLNVHLCYRYTSTGQLDHLNLCEQIWTERERKRKRKREILLCILSRPTPPRTPLGCILSPA